VDKVIFSRFERNSVDEMKNILLSDSTLSPEDKRNLEKMIARLDAKKSPYLSDKEIKQFQSQKTDLKEIRILVSIIWPISIIAILYFGFIPGRHDGINWAEEPGWFIVGIFVWISVGFYYWFGSDGT